MKRILSGILALCGTVVAQTPEQQWQAKAVQKYLDLRIKGTDLNTRFVEGYNMRRATTPDFFNDPRWSLILADELARTPSKPKSNPSQTAAWKEEMRKGYLPYHLLTGADFPVNDEVHPEAGMRTCGFIHYRYEDRWIRLGGHVVAQVTEWLVWSGFDRNKSSRKSWFALVKETLPHEQGHLDINELYNRHLAETPLGQLPRGEGISQPEAFADLSRKLAALVVRVNKENEKEQARYDAETEHGQNVVEQRKWTTAIQERLERAHIYFSSLPD